MERREVCVCGGGGGARDCTKNENGAHLPADQTERGRTELTDAGNERNSHGTW